MPMHDIVFVVNKNDFHHADAFDGIQYEFPPGEKVQVPVDAAVHMFGYGLADKTDTLVRLGWASRYNAVIKRMEEDPTGVRRLAKFVFTKAVMVEDTAASPLRSGAPEIA